MPPILHKSFTAFQTQFHSRHGHLRDQHVRALAWLLTAPNLFDPLAPRWHGAIAVLNGMADDMDVDAWLRTLDADPAALHALVDARPTARLGRYAEKLLAFYLQLQGRLFATNLQVRAGANATIGEFDYLLHDAGAGGGALIHWEFATKFYLLESQRSAPQAECFVGPNLADTLGAKMSKIMDRQLRLSHHPAAAAYLPLPVSHAQALVKGWLFYRDAAVVLPEAMGVASDHCRGFWRTGDELAADPEYADARYVILPRLQWLAPTQSPLAMTLTPARLQLALAASFASDPAPVLVAVMNASDASPGMVLEASRGFIVPENWRTLAAERITIGVR
ncbi:DUF1853 family protein [Oxalobacteraceae bacterium CAVE-383]|nr:DUF1853 family protein [Oxalobacteraceae bacterium CAVE-383]